MSIAELEPKLLSDLHMVAGELGIKNYRKYSKQDLIMSRKHEMSFATRGEAVVGIDELKQKGAIEDEDLGYRPYY